MITLKRIELSGFKSIEQMSLELGPLNVLIGANGAGKSNLLSFLSLLRYIGKGSLRHWVAHQNHANAVLFYGAKRTRQIKATLEFDTPSGAIRYAFTLGHTDADELVFDDERFAVQERWRGTDWEEELLGSGHKESKVSPYNPTPRPGAADLCDFLTACRVYHFNDTSETAGIRQHAVINDVAQLRHDAENLAVVLHRLKQRNEHYYHRIVETIRQIAPWFRDFELGPSDEGGKTVYLNWRGEDPDYVFAAHQLPDGGLRAMALITLLLQPDSRLPRIVAIDEPELGLHPSAVGVLAALLKQASLHCQVIVATQSPTFLDEFDPEDVVVVDREGGTSTFTRQSSERLHEWLEEYSLGELWQKNIMGGGPF